jgi:hypothetical protein
MTVISRIGEEDDRHGGVRGRVDVEADMTIEEEDVASLAVPGDEFAFIGTDIGQGTVQITRPQGGWIPGYGFESGPPRFPST